MKSLHGLTFLGLVMGSAFTCDTQPLPYDPHGSRDGMGPGEICANRQESELLHVVAIPRLHRLARHISEDTAYVVCCRERDRQSVIEMGAVPIHLAQCQDVLDSSRVLVPQSSRLSSNGLNT